ncbi:MAG: DUF5916 domain-containing protein [Bacteroidota bacterium]
MNTTKAIAFALLFTLNQGLISQDLPRSYQAASIQGKESINIDGVLKEQAWLDESNEWSSKFTQRLPNEGDAPTHQTEFKICYDNQFLYVGILCKEKESNDINRWMSRRDGYNGDWIEVIIDSYHDKRTAFSFTLSAAGVKSDKYITLNGADEDMAWNPIWYARSRLNKKGWTAEMKIPLSQLRFSGLEGQIWGLQVQRRIHRNEELSVWQRVPQDAPGWVSEFGELRWDEPIQPQRQLELQPFVVGSINTFEKDPDNPFRDSNISSVNAGLDGKIGITNDITLDFTLNPDFGQVEADPGAIALDGFQLFFQEQRSFFIENKNVFDYRFSTPITGGVYSTDNLFYSRRIGRSPQGSVLLEDDQYADIPQRTTILGAVKLSGKTKNGLSFGLLESVTSQETAEISDGSSQRIEPLTNYLVARALLDLNDRKTFIGGVFTSALRSQYQETNFLHQSAHTGGLDFLHQWQDRNWYVGANLVMSHVAGSKESILRTQQAIPHLFQRGASHVNIDSSRTTLTGSGGDIKIGKAGNGHIQAEVGITWRSPNLELNDIGFMREADIIQQYAGVFYRSINSFGAFRSARIGYQHWLNWDFEGNLNYIDWDISTEATFQNNWSTTLGFFSQPHTYSKSLLQGGPRLSLADQHGFWWALNSDSRKKLYVSYSGWTKTGPAGSYDLLENNMTFNYQPLDRFRMSLSPKYTQINHRLQYNESIVLEGERHDIVSMMDQRTISLALRADIIINPNMAVQYYAEPFISTGEYRNFNTVANPLQSYDENQLAPLLLSGEPEQATYEVDINRNGNADGFIGNPDFSYAQFRSNLVYRWEYKPGSELYLVWSQGMSDTSLPRDNPIASFRNQIFSRVLENTFLIKLTYRFHR